MPRPVSNLRVKIARLAGRSIGVSTAELAPFTIRQAGRAVEHMVAANEIFRGRASGKNVRFFSRLEAAEAFADAAKIARAAPPPEKEVVAKWSKDSPPIFPVDANGVPTWKLTHCPPDMTGTVGTNTHGSY